MIGVTLYYLANLMRDSGRLDRAEALYDQAEQLLESLVDPDHRFLAELKEERAKLDAL